MAFGRYFNDHSLKVSHILEYNEGKIRILWILQNFSLHLLGKFVSPTFQYNLKLLYLTGIYEITMLNVIHFSYDMW